MRVLLTAYAEKTHFLAMIPLAWALRTAGHDVRVASQPALTDVITAAGLTAVPVGTDHRMWAVAERFLTGRFAEVYPEAARVIRETPLPPFELVARTTPAGAAAVAEGSAEVVKAYRMANATMLDELVELARAWRPDLVLWEPMTHAGALAAAACGADHGRVLWSVDAFGAMRVAQLRHVRAGAVDPLRDWLAAEAKLLGLAWSEEFTTGKFTVDQLPAGVGLPTGLPSVPCRYVPYNGRSEVPRWLWEPPQRRRVALTLGSSPTERFGSYAIDLQDLLDALGELDVEIVATVGADRRQTITRVPTNTRVVEFVPLNDLVPTCAAVINHAGYGTINTVALHGVPQVLLPEVDDAPLVAERIAGLGAGISTPMREAAGPLVADAVTRVLTETRFAAAARSLRDRMLAAPSPHDVVTELERRVAGHPRPSTTERTRHDRHRRHHPGPRRRSQGA